MIIWGLENKDILKIEICMIWGTWEAKHFQLMTHQMEGKIVRI